MYVRNNPQQSPSKKAAGTPPETEELVRALMEENEALRGELAADREVRGLAWLSRLGCVCVYKSPCI